MRRRPLPVTIIGCVYILTGAVTGAFHFTQAWAHRPLSSDLIWIELTAAAAIVAGAFLLRGCDWARWLALAWMAFHVVLSVFHTLPELAIHSVFLLALAYFLLRPSANRYFRSARTATV
jgi:hypothetical protein